jgi:hypothetical protein
MMIIIVTAPLATVNGEKDESPRFGLARGFDGVRSTACRALQRPGCASSFREAQTVNQSK